MLSAASKWNKVAHRNIVRWWELGAYMGSVKADLGVEFRTPYTSWRDHFGRPLRSMKASTMSTAPWRQPTWRVLELFTITTGRSARIEDKTEWALDVATHLRP